MDPKDTLSCNICLGSVRKKGRRVRLQWPALVALIAGQVRRVARRAKATATAPGKGSIEVLVRGRGSASPLLRETKVYVGS